MTIKVKLAAIAKDEAAYIPQWIHHHLLFGFQEIEIWLNNTTDNSMALLSDIQKSHPDGVIKFRNSDDFLRKCLADDLPFQQLAYSDIYYQTLDEAKCTHILFLDLDEFWVPANFTSSVNELITDAPDSDAISYQWYIDTPDVNKHIFSPPFSYTNSLQKNRHVKTLTKLTTNMKELSVHNHIIENGVYSLASGERFPGTDKETLCKSLIPTSYHKQHGNTLERAFILHQINRTPIEYLSSLLRGRGHKNDDNVFKVNRIGYLEDNHSLPPCIFFVSIDAVVKYNSSLAKYCALFADHIEEARGFIVQRFNSAVEKIRHNPEYLTRYRDQLRGVKINDLSFEKLTSPQIFYSVDKTTIAGNSILIEGWAFDALSVNPPEITIKTRDGLTVNSRISIQERLDVIRVYPDAPSKCGFKITIIELISTDIDLVMRTVGGVQTVPISISAS